MALHVAARAHLSLADLSERGALVENTNSKCHRLG